MLCGVTLDGHRWFINCYVLKSSIEVVDLSEYDILLAFFGFFPPSSSLPPMGKCKALR